MNKRQRVCQHHNRDLYDINSHPLEADHLLTLISSPSPSKTRSSVIYHIVGETQFSLKLASQVDSRKSSANDNNIAVNGRHNLSSSNNAVENVYDASIILGHGFYLCHFLVNNDFVTRKLTPMGMPDQS